MARGFPQLSGKFAITSMHVNVIETVTVRDLERLTPSAKIA
jgi:hypothetical protein